MNKQLINSQLFIGLNEHEVNNILANTHHNISHFNEGDLIAISGEEVKTMMMVVNGRVRGEMLDASGKSFRIEDLDQNRVLAPGFLFGSSTILPVNILASEPSDILFIPKASFLDLLGKNEVVLKNYLDILSDKTQFLAMKIKSVFLQSIEGKIANYLLTLSSQKDSLNFEMDKSQGWLAERFSVARPSVARVFSKMNSKGVIESKGKMVNILNIQELRNCINQV